MMDNGGSRNEVTRAVKRAILLNEYLLRRAWGVLYIVLALSMLFSIFGVTILEVAKSFGFTSAIAIDMTASGCGLVVILWAFKRVRNSADITHPEGDRAWSKLLGYRFLVPIWIAINAVVVLTIAFASTRVSLVDLLIHLGLAVYLYYALKLSFAKKIPGESIIAIGSLALSSVASLALLTIVANPGPYAILWLTTIAAWIFSGVYARTRPIPEFEEESTGLE